MYDKWNLFRCETCGQVELHPRRSPQHADRPGIADEWVCSIVRQHHGTDEEGEACHGTVSYLGEVKVYV